MSCVLGKWGACRTGGCRSPHAPFTWRQGGSDDARSSLGGAMFVATDATGYAKLQRSGMASRWRSHHWRAVGCKMRFSAAPEGAWPSLQGGHCYKHGAPNGAEPISDAEDTCKVQPTPSEGTRLTRPAKPPCLRRSGRGRRALVGRVPPPGVSISFILKIAKALTAGRKMNFIPAEQVSRLMNRWTGLRLNL